jgi:hypothetical protein
MHSHNLPTNDFNDDEGKLPEEEAEDSGNAEREEIHL